MGQLRAGAPSGPARAGRSASNNRLNLITRSLRIGVVYDGRIVQEQLIPPGSPVTVGSDPGCTIVIARTARRFTLIETRRGKEVFHFTDGMRGKIAQGGRIRTLDRLVTDGRAQRGRTRNTMRLRHEHRGKVRIGDTTVLFQFVRTPPMPAGRRGPSRFGAWQWGQVDWLFLAIIMLSGLLHTAGMIWIEGQPPPTREQARDALEDRFVRYVPPAPIPEATPEPVELEQDVLAATPEPTTSEVEPGDDPSAGGAPGQDTEAPPPETEEERLARLTGEVEQTGLLALIGTAGKSSTQMQVEDLLADGNLGEAQHDAIARARVGGERNDGLTGLRGGSATDGLAGSMEMAEVIGTDGGRVIKESVELVGTAETGTWEEPEESTDYDVRKQMKRYLGQMKRCYEKELKGDPDLTGKVTLSWTIQTDGDLAAVSVDGNSTGSDALSACVAKTMRRIRFAPPPVELDVEGYPLLFDRQ